jgi:hypothetical protein
MWQFQFLSAVFSSSEHPNQLWSPPNLLFNGYWGSFLGVKGPGNENDHSPPSGTQIKSELTPWSRVLPEKLKCPKLLKKFATFYGTQRFITVFPILSQIDPVSAPPIQPLKDPF